MKKSIFLLLCIFLFTHVRSEAQKSVKVAPGIWKVTFGVPEKIRPTDFKMAPFISGLKNLPDNSTPPVNIHSILFEKSKEGVVARMKLSELERVYGFGLQVNTFEQRGLRREIRINSWIDGNLGFSHASMPFFISSKGYGILVNSSRNITFYMGSQHKLEQSVGLKKTLAPSAVALSPRELYNRQYKPSEDIEILIRGTEGVELFIFDGPDMMNVVQRYNLFSGGGAMPPLWGLGLKYRAKTDFNASEVLDFVKYFRSNNFPCDMFGLEPGWHSAAYSCSYSWNKKNFPNPDSLLNVIHGMNYKLSLWEHAYVHPTSPIFDSIVPLSGDYAVWKGAVPDFTLSKARQIFGKYHRTNFIDKGVSSFKLDECDAAYYHEAHAEWSFPDIAKFPSGIDGVQMRQMFGILYQKTLWDQYRAANRRTLLEVRASHLFAAPYCSSLYSDMYNHGDFIRMIVNSGFAGVCWSPEVRETTSDADLIRRLQTILMSSQMVVDCWFLKNLPWYQYDRDKNNKGEMLPNYRDLEQKAKRLVQIRMSLIPYLYAAFARYHFEGTPPFRALVLDYPSDPRVWKIDNQYMMGEAIMCAPFIDGASTRKIYFPSGVWYHFSDGKKYTGGKEYEITMSLDEIPMFVKEGTILPLAEPVEYITPETVFELHCKIYGTPGKPVRLFEDNSYTFDFEKGDYNWVNLSWDSSKIRLVRNGNFKNTHYKLKDWEMIK